VKMPSESEPAVLIQGDCRDYLPGLTGKGDAVITDPPYGIDFGRTGGFSASHGWDVLPENVQWDRERPPRELIDAVLALGVPTVIWGGNYFTDWLPPSMGWIAWDKGQRDFSLADFEMAWTSENKAARCVVYPRGNAVRDGKFHPTQKPVWVMRQCIDYLQRGRKKPIRTIIDPFCGSGSTGVACVQAGLQFIGIEREEQYVATARRRIDEALGVGSLFPAVQPSALDLFAEAP
jgi:hypothetical protein